MKRHTLAAFVCLMTLGVQLPAMAADPNDWDPPPRGMASPSSVEVHGVEGATSTAAAGFLLSWEMWLESLWRQLAQ